MIYNNKTTLMVKNKLMKNQIFHLVKQISIILLTKNKMIVYLEVLIS
jgi:hypothetical protein